MLISKIGIWQENQTVDTDRLGKGYNLPKCLCYTQPELEVPQEVAAFLPEELWPSWSLLLCSTWIELLMFLTSLSSSRIDIHVFTEIKYFLLHIF